MSMTFAGQRKQFNKQFQKARLKYGAKVRKQYYWNPKTKALAADKWIRFKPEVLTWSLANLRPRRRFWRMYETMDRRREISIRKQLVVVRQNKFLIRNQSTKLVLWFSNARMRKVKSLSRVNIKVSDPISVSGTIALRRKQILFRKVQILLMSLRMRKLQRFVRIYLRSQKVHKKKFATAVTALKANKFFSAGLILFWRFAVYGDKEKCVFAKFQPLLSDWVRLSPELQRVRQTLRLMFTFFERGLRPKHLIWSSFKHFFKFWNLMHSFFFTQTFPLTKPSKSRVFILSKRPLCRRKKYVPAKFSKLYVAFQKRSWFVFYWKRVHFLGRFLSVVDLHRYRLKRRQSWGKIIHRKVRVFKHRYRRGLWRPRRRLFRVCIPRLVYGRARSFFKKHQNQFTSLSKVCPVFIVSAPSRVVVNTEVIIFSIVSAHLFQGSPVRVEDSMKSNVFLFWYANPFFYFGLDIFGFELYKIYLVNLKTNNTHCHVSAARSLLKKNPHFSVVYTKLLRSYIRLLKLFYTLSFGRKMAKNIPSSSILQLIDKFHELTGFLKSARVFRQGVYWQWRTQYNTMKNILQDKEGLFKLRILFDRLFLWLYGRKNIRYVFNRLVKKGTFLSYAGKFQILYKKSFKVRFMDQSLF